MVLPRIVLACLLSALAACSRGPECAQADRACAQRALPQHSARRIEFWNRELKRPLALRIGPAPAQLLDYLALDNIAQGVPNHPRKPDLTPEFLTDLHAAFDELPDEVTQRLANRLVGIYLVDNLGGSAYTEDVIDEQGRAVAAVVVLDAGVLSSRPANAWATWKENTPFAPEAGWALSAQIEAPERDTQKYAIQYILLHELGHAISVGNAIHPSWSQPPPRNSAGYAYFNLSWTVSPQGQYESQFENDFPQRRDVVYYFGAKLPASQMAPVYQALERTNFPTLYAARNPPDDFAEGFANYVHTMLLHQPFEIRISKDGEVVNTYGACWKQLRCAAKRRVIEQLLAAP